MVCNETPASVLNSGSTQAEDWLRGALGLDASEAPFPWQIELLRRFREGKNVPSLDIPTGLGKTAVMAVWLVARALGAALPRRLVYVVDRRAVVDQATEVAESLCAWVAKERGVSKALGLDDHPLPISTLRGQHVDNRVWLEDPSLPAIVVGTVDMVGSRLLFSGYGISSKMRPYHAGLIGADALIVLDEAHLVPAFEAMARSVVTGGGSMEVLGSAREIVPKSYVMSLSATGRSDANALQLGDADRAHEVVRRRLDAEKAIHLARPVEVDVLSESLARKAWELTERGMRAFRVLVFADSRKVAQDISELITKLAKPDGSTVKIAIETELLVGGRRVAERARAAERLAELGLIAGSKSRSDKPVFVIATSAGEVGIDLDAEHAVLDLVEWERMVQRLGRVNRRGEGEAVVWVVPSKPDQKLTEMLEKDAKLRKRTTATDLDGSDPDETEDDSEAEEGKRLKPGERERVDRHWRREATLLALSKLPESEGSFLASPRALGAIKAEHGDLIEQASTPVPLYPALTRAVVESWSMTSLEEHTGRPSVRPWLRGWVEEEAQTAIAWRTWLPEKADARAFFDAAPVETVETLEMESALVLDWIGKRVKQLVKSREEVIRTQKDAAEASDTEGNATRERPALTLDDVVMFVLDGHLHGWTLGELDALDKRRRDDLLRELYDATIVVDARLGGLHENGLLSATHKTTATDVSEMLRLPFRVRETDDPDVEGDDDWRQEATFVSRASEEGEPISWLVVESDKRQQSTTAEGRSTGREQRLDEHQAFAERHARGIGVRVGLGALEVDLLALAAVLHDEGKKVERWQRAFRAPKEKRPLGKTTGRPLQSILAGYRHELGSLPYAERDVRVAALSPEDRDLVLHLIAAHHGFARPILRTDGYDEAPPSRLVEQARTIALRFARLEKHWGPWGLAWWETLLRAADQAASRENDERGNDCG